jgi:hypothetical protein
MYPNWDPATVPLGTRPDALVGALFGRGIALTPAAAELCTPTAEGAFPLSLSEMFVPASPCHGKNG